MDDGKIYRTPWKIPWNLPDGGKAMDSGYDAQPIQWFIASLETSETSVCSHLWMD